MNASVNHLFVRAPAEEVTAAWRRFVAQEVGSTPENVYVIPADGGCFIVVLTPRAGIASLVRAPRLLSRPRLSFSKRRLEQFLEFFEGDWQAGGGLRLPVTG